MEELYDTVTCIGCYTNIVYFLIARLFFINGLTTLFAFGGIYAAAAFGMDAKGILIFGIILHAFSGIGAFAFAWVDDWIGGKNLIVLALIGLIIPCTLILIVTDPTIFLILGCIIGIFVGPVQAASRSLMARISPPELRNEMFGFFALSGKATAFIGQPIVGWLIYWTGNQRIGMSIIVVFFIIGLFLMIPVKDEICE